VNSNKVKFSVVNNKENWEVKFDIKDNSLLGKSAWFDIELALDISDKLLDKKKSVYRKKITFFEDKMVLLIPISEVKVYPYKGEFISTSVSFNLDIIQSNILLNSKITSQPLKKLKHSADKEKKAEQILEPNDVFNLSTNLKTIIGSHRTLAFIYIIIGAILLTVFGVIGIYDQSIQPSQNVILFPQGHSIGKGAILNHPLIKAICLNFFIFLLFWYLMKKELRTYISKPKVNWPEEVNQQTVLSVNKLIDGLITSNLENLVVKIVAGNYEKYSYFDVMANQQKITVHPKKAIVLYEKRIPKVSKGDNLSIYFDNEEFQLSKIFDTLFPTVKYDSKNGLFLHWEVQILHKDLIDHEIVGCTSIFNLSDFSKVY